MYWLHSAYLKLENKIAEIGLRENISINPINNLKLIENIILHYIENGIQENKKYKEIY